MAFRVPSLCSNKALGTPRGRPIHAYQGLTLVEALVTLFLVSLAFSLIFTLSRVQARVTRQQEVVERFIVDAEACLSLLESDLGSAFLAAPTNGSKVLQMACLVRTSKPDDGAAPFNSEPFSTHRDPDEPVSDFRGTPLLTTYTLKGEKLERTSAPLATPAAAFSKLPLLVGVNSAKATVAGSRVEIKLTLLSEGRAHTIDKVIYAPGLTL